MKVRTLDDIQVAAIVDLVRARSGLTFGPSRRLQVESGIRQAMAGADVADANRFFTLLQTNERAFQALIERLTVAETYFFREREQFEVLRRNILPQLRQSHRDGEMLRFWSAGCASGEEPYSLAMLLDREGLAERATILATDISCRALGLARKGSYGAWSFRDSALDIAAPYVERQGERLVVIERVRRMVDFDVFNLAAGAYPCRITGPCGLDLILCRNVLIYFDSDTVERVAHQLFAALRDGGWLITGPSDPPLWLHAPYETILTPAGVLYRRPDAAVARRNEPAPVKLPAPLHHGSDMEAVLRGAVASAAAAVRPAHGLSHRTPSREDTQTADIAELPAPADLANVGHAGTAVASAFAPHPLSAELHYLRAIRLMDRGRYEEAISSLRGALYLDRSMAVAHFALGSVQALLGADDKARRSYRNVLALCGDRRTDEIVPFSDGECVGRLAAAARAQLDCIGRRA